MGEPTGDSDRKPGGRTKERPGPENEMTADVEADPGCSMHAEGQGQGVPCPSAGALRSGVPVSIAKLEAHGKRLLRGFQCSLRGLSALRGFRNPVAKPPLSECAPAPRERLPECLDIAHPGIDFLSQKPHPKRGEHRGVTTTPPMVINDQ